MMPVLASLPGRSTGAGQLLRVTPPAGGSQPVSSFSLVSAGPIAESGAPAFGQATGTGNLLVALVGGNGGNGGSPITLASGSGWTQATPDAGSAGAWATIWYKNNSSASETAPTFGGSSDVWAQLLEFSGQHTGTVLGQVTPAAYCGVWELQSQFADSDSVGGALILTCLYWNVGTGGGTGTGSASYVAYTDCDGAALSPVAYQEINATYGVGFASSWATAGVTGSFPHVLIGSLDLGPGFCMNAATFQPATPVRSALAVTTSSLPAAMTNFAYAGGAPGMAAPDVYLGSYGVWGVTLAASGGTPPYTWAVTSGSLPSGLSLSGAVISGTPDSAGTSDFTVQVTDNTSATVTAGLSITVTASPSLQTTMDYTSVTNENLVWSSPSQVSEITGNTSTSGDPHDDVFGGGYPFVGTNVWGPYDDGTNHTTETINVYSPTQWTMTTNVPDPAGNASVVHSFPNTGWFYNETPANYSYIVAGWTENFQHSDTTMASGCFDNYAYMNDVLNTTNNEFDRNFEWMLHFDESNRNAHGGAAQAFEGNVWQSAVSFGGYSIDVPGVGEIYIKQHYWNMAYGISGGSLVPASGTYMGTPYNFTDDLQNHADGAWPVVFYGLSDANGNPISDPGPCAVDLLAMWNYIINNSDGNVKSYWPFAGFSIGYEICSTQGNTVSFQYQDVFCYAG